MVKITRATDIFFFSLVSRKGGKKISVDGRGKKNGENKRLGGVSLSNEEKKKNRKMPDLNLVLRTGVLLFDRRLL